MKHLVAILVFAALSPTFAQRQSHETHEGWVFNPQDYEVPLAYRQELEANLLWMIARERRIAGREKVEPVVGVYADSGVWHLGARSIVFALEREGIPVRVLDHAAMGQGDFKGLKAIIVPGGYAFHMKDGVGEAGMAAIRRLVSSGGTYLGVCAGGFFAAKTVRWEGESFPYPLGLFDGTAEGSLPNIAVWPKSAGVRLTLADKRPEFQLLDDEPIYYQGGCRFVGGTEVNVIATYPDKSAAIIERKVGSGRIVLSGGHIERLAPTFDSNASKPPPKFAGRSYAKLMRLEAKPGAVSLQPWNAREFRSSFNAETKLDTMLAREAALRVKLSSLKKK